MQFTALGGSVFGAIQQSSVSGAIQTTQNCHGAAVSLSKLSVKIPPDWKDHLNLGEPFSIWLAVNLSGFNRGF